MIALALLLAAAIIPCADPSLLEAKLRGRVVAMYAKLQTPRMRLVPDTSRIPISVVGPAWAAKWNLERDGGSRPGGTEAATLVWTSSDGSRVRRDWIQVRIGREELVPFAKGRMERGERLDTARLDWRWTRTDGMRTQPPDADSVASFRTRTGISPGQAVWRTQLERLPVFRSGQPVRIVTGSRGTIATVEGIAVEDGTPGTATRDKTPWGRTLVGTTEDDGSVRIPSP